MLARVLAVALCLSVYTSRCSVETDELIEIVLIWVMGASFHLSYTVLKGNSGISRNEGTPLWKFVPNSGLQKILLPPVDRRNMLSTIAQQGGRSERNKLDRRRSLS